MDTQPNRHSARLANASLILGLISFGFALVSFVPIIWGRSTGGPDAILLAAGLLALFLMLGGLILGTPGFIMGIIALVRVRNQIDHNKIMGTAILGIVLNSLGIAVFLFFLMDALLSTPIR